MMKRIGAAMMCVLLGALVLSAPEANAQTACEYYRVKAGDTLRSISTAAYGSRDQYQLIYTENRGEIGRNPNRIFPGTVLRVPCPDGRFPTAETRAESTEAVVDADTLISFVTANGYLPYTDEGLRHRGFITHLVNNAMLRATPETEIEVVFVNDWSAHLETLLPRQAFHASFPWTMPDCQDATGLSSSERTMCADYVFSDPLYEIVEGFFAKNGTGFDAAVDIADFAGRKICRPEGYPTGHFHELGLNLENVEMLRMATAHECFVELMFGRVDLVSLDTRSGERVMTDLGVNFEVTENPHLFSIQSLRVAAHKDNPSTNQLITDLNRGLGIMFESGEWNGIVSEGLASQARSQASAQN